MNSQTEEVMFAAKKLLSNYYDNYKNYKSEAINNICDPMMRDARIVSRAILGLTAVEQNEKPRNWDDNQFLQWAIKKYSKENNHES